MVRGQYNLFFQRQINTTYNFIDGDSEELYKENLLKKPIDWFYRNNPITYKYNSSGFRCHEFNDLNFNNYILFLGDSHTEGVGLHLEDTYAYKVSKQLHKSYANLGIGGTGIDIMFFNLITWLHTFPHPKYIVLYYSESTRTIIKPQNTHRYENISINWPGIQEGTKNFLVNGDLVGFFNGRINMYVDMIDTILKHHKIPYKNISSFSQSIDEPHEIEVITSNDKPRARDVHVGVEWHNEVTELLVNDYHDKYSNATVNSTIRGESL